MPDQFVMVAVPIAGLTTIIDVSTYCNWIYNTQCTGLLRIGVKDSRESIMSRTQMMSHSKRKCIWSNASTIYSNACISTQMEMPRKCKRKLARERKRARGKRKILCARNDPETAEFQNDFYGIEKIREWMEEKIFHERSISTMLWSTIWTAIDGSPWHLVGHYIRNSFKSRVGLINLVSGTIKDSRSRLQKNEAMLRRYECKNQSS